MSIKKLMFVLTVITFVLFSCKKEDTSSSDAVISENPTVVFTVNPGYVYTDTIMEREDSIYIGIEASSYNNVPLKTLTLTRSFEGDVPVKAILPLTEIDAQSAAGFYYGGNAVMDGKEIWTATVSDEYNNSSTATITITTNDGFEKTAGGYFYSINAPDSFYSNYNLEADTLVSVMQTDSVMDMRNNDGFIFTGHWTNNNGTKFVKTTIDYDSTKYSEIVSAYQTLAQTASSAVYPVTGDLYIAQLRNELKYAIIKVTDIDPTNNDCQCDTTSGFTGKLTFEYKK